MSEKFKNNLIGIAIFVGGLIAINIWRGPPDMSFRNQSLNEMVHSGLNRFHYACQHLWEEQGPDENCTKESIPKMLLSSFDLPGINISGNGNQEDWQATARHDNLMDQIFIIDASGIINKLDPPHK
ncbi:MAG: hypothetical protein HN472_03190 [Nitrospina sp.]|jgi:hypothetical protein|nr:hypothetical protein [Nitrospina sp.]MBT3508530.1 hypothetical protein [Nitrospina sp.]MBT3875306.1 hypothetical protein [Nitrospina sp.]MBT4048609.1 hypothetical protein [Nitrospina sp.]MBT4559037.1 hypothetical protein [Nitrospina sp.]